MVRKEIEQLAEKTVERPSLFVMETDFELVPGHSRLLSTNGQPHELDLSARRQRAPSIQELDSPTEPRYCLPPMRSPTKDELLACREKGHVRVGREFRDHCVLDQTVR
jgi:hypothetical protein